MREAARKVNKDRRAPRRSANRHRPRRNAVDAARAALNLARMSETLTPMMQQYQSVRRSLPADTLLFFRLGDFYEMFFDDAKTAASLLNVALTKRNGVPMCGVPYHARDGYIAKLIKAGKRVAICGNRTNASRASIHPNAASADSRGAPTGTYQNDCAERFCESSPKNIWFPRVPLATETSCGYPRVRPTTGTGLGNDRIVSRPSPRRGTRKTFLIDDSSSRKYGLKIA